jgi:hypothetical protein
VLIDDAFERIRTLGVQRPERFAHMLAPFGGV